MKLSNATLSDLPDPILRPSYDRSAQTPGILHIGLGNFHRAHQLCYLHRQMQQGLVDDLGGWRERFVEQVFVRLTLKKTRL